MDCKIKILYVAGNYTELKDIDYDFAINSIKESSSDSLMIWTFNNKDFIFNMKNVEFIEISKVN